MGQESPLHEELFSASRTVEARARALSLTTPFAVSSIVARAAVDAEKLYSSLTAINRDLTI